MTPPVNMNELIPVVMITSGISTIFGLGAKMIWDYFTKGRVTQEHMKITDCEKIRNSCGALELVKQYQTNREHDIGHDADISSRIQRVETRLDDGQTEFKELRKDFNCMNKNIARIATVIELKWGTTENIQEILKGGKK